MVYLICGVFLIVLFGIAYYCGHRGLIYIGTIEHY